jgi:hypothetical protein
MSWRLVPSETHNLGLDSRWGDGRRLDPSGDCEVLTQNRCPVCVVAFFRSVSFDVCFLSHVILVHDSPDQQKQYERLGRNSPFHLAHSILILWVFLHPFPTRRFSHSYSLLPFWSRYLFTLWNWYAIYTRYQLSVSITKKKGIRTWVDCGRS